MRGGWESREEELMATVHAISCEKNQRGSFNIEKVISVADSPTTDDKGETIGLIRVLCYKTKAE